MTLVRLLLVLATVSTAGEIVAADRPLIVDHSQSRIEVAVKATMDSFVGRLGSYEAEIALGDDGMISRGLLAFHFRDLETGKEGRDKAMHKWQDSEKFPDGQFVLSSLEPRGGGAATAKGRLTLHGVAREVSFPVSIQRDNGRVAIDGDAAVDTREFSLSPIRMLAVLKVDPVVHVRFHLQGTTEPATQLTNVRP
jgi:polyisoprenoid-binding protein YceI